MKHTNISKTLSYFMPLLAVTALCATLTITAVKAHEVSSPEQSSDTQTVSSTQPSPDIDESVDEPATGEPATSPKPAQVANTTTTKPAQTPKTTQANTATPVATKTTKLAVVQAAAPIQQQSASSPTTTSTTASATEELPPDSIPSESSLNKDPKSNSDLNEGPLEEGKATDSSNPTINTEDGASSPDVE